MPAPRSGSCGGAATRPADGRSSAPAPACRADGPARSRAACTAPSSGRRTRRLSWMKLLGAGGRARRRAWLGRRGSGTPARGLTASWSRPSDARPAALGSPMAATHTARHRRTPSASPRCPGPRPAPAARRRPRSTPPPTQDGRVAVEPAAARGQREVAVDSYMHVDEVEPRRELGPARPLIVGALTRQRDAIAVDACPGQRRRCRGDEGGVASAAQLGTEALPGNCHPSAQRRGDDRVERRGRVRPFPQDPGTGPAPRSRVGDRKHLSSGRALP